MNACSPEARRRAVSNYRKRHISQGLCSQCSNVLAPNSRHCCEMHLKLRRSWRPEKISVTCPDCKAERFVNKSIWAKQAGLCRVCVRKGKLGALYKHGLASKHADIAIQRKYKREWLREWRAKATPEQKLAQAKRDWQNELKRVETIAGRPIADHCEACGDHYEPNYIHHGRRAKKRNRLHFDHDHETGKFRGWLCPDCNAALGYLKDNPSRISGLLEYIKHFRP